ncbi:MAG: AzlC family ABC transporter permease [Chloroflexota bacterium]|nr:AzlC family ABC transporter permease [Chloroflexota bacterium]MDE3193498.1 AzlC family ABC transporter permease [Chloroflexota bacterium]
MPAQRSSYRQGLRLAIPFAIAVSGFGITFGALAHATNVDLLAIVVMSATTFGGSAQFAAVSVLAQGSSVGAAVVAAVLLQARYVPMSVAAAPAFTGPWWKRLLLGQLIVDESWAIGNRGDGTFDRAKIVAAGALLYVNWVLWSFVGAAGAELLKDPRALGLDAAFPALFLAILWPYVRERRAALAAALGAAIALVASLFVPPGVPIVVATVACVVGLRR